MLSALLNTGTTENTSIVGVTSSQINILEMERGLGDELTKLKGERQTLVDELQLSKAEEERAKLASILNALDEEIEKTYNSALDNAKKLDKLIEKNNQIEVDLMEKETSRFQRVVVSFERSTDFPQLPPIKIPEAGILL